MYQSKIPAVNVIVITQAAFTCSKLTIETPRCEIYSVNPGGIYLLQVNKRNPRTRCEIYSVNNKDTRTTPMALLLTLNIFHSLF